LKMPELKFVPLKDTSEDAFEIWWHGSHTSDVLVYLRYRYDCEKNWTYSIEFATSDAWDTIIWANDWWEGQEHVEYLGVCEIDEGLEEAGT